MIEESTTLLVAAIIVLVLLTVGWLRETPWYRWRKQRPSMYMSVSDPRFRGALVQWRENRPRRLFNG